jgi:hypothetical protein
VEQAINPNFVRDEWEMFARVTLTPLGIGPTSRQYLDTRLAFYAGAAAMLLVPETMAKKSWSSGYLVEQIDSIQQEVIHFLSAVREEIEEGIDET